MAEEELSSRCSNGSDSETWETSVDEGRTKSKNKLLPDGFLDPLPPQKSSKLPRLAGIMAEPTNNSVEQHAKRLADSDFRPTPAEIDPSIAHLHESHCVAHSDDMFRDSDQSPRRDFFSIFTRKKIVPGSHPSQAGTNSEQSSTTAPVEQRDSAGHETTASRIYIEPDGDTFHPWKQATHKIRDIIRSKFDAPYTSWKKIPQNIRNIWFREFERDFTWLPQNRERIRRNFERRVATRFRDMFTDIRKVGQRPIWIGEGIWADLCKEWGTPKYTELRFKNKQNRASDCGGIGASLHTGGSVPHTEHQRRLKEMLGRDPTMAELHLRTHQHQQNQQWVDERSRYVHDEYVRVREQQTQSSQGEPLSSQRSEFETWEKVAGGRKKGRIYGLGSLASASSQSLHYVDSSDSTLEATMKKHMSAWEREYEKRLRAMQAEMQEQMRAERAEMQAEIVALRQVVGNGKQVVVEEEEEEDLGDDKIE